MAGWVDRDEQGAPCHLIFETWNSLIFCGQSEPGDEGDGVFRAGDDAVGLRNAGACVFDGVPQAAKHLVGKRPSRAGGPVGVPGGLLAVALSRRARMSVQSAFSAASRWLRSTWAGSFVCRRISRVTTTTRLIRNASG